jgi:rod shape-determining protein MreC
MAPARDRRTGFSRRRQYSVFVSYVLAVAGAIVGAVLLVVSSFNPPAFAALRMGAASITAPVSSAFAAAIGGIVAIPQGIGHYFFVHSENAELREVLERQRALVLRARAVVVENRHLHRLLQVRDRSTDTVVLARLVSSSASSGRRFAVLNAGRWSGVRPGMPVRAADGLVGRILETGPNAARVLLLSDSESIVPLRRTRDGLPAVAAGRGDGRIDVRAVSGTNVRFLPGDLFVTSGVGGLYAPGIPVAKLDVGGIDTAATGTLATPDSLDIAMVERAFMPMPAPPPAAP